MRTVFCSVLPSPQPSVVIGLMRSSWVINASGFIFGAVEEWHGSDGFPDDQEVCVYLRAAIKAEVDEGVVILVLLQLPKPEEHDYEVYFDCPP